MVACSAQRIDFIGALCNQVLCVCLMRKLCQLALSVNTALHWDR